MDLAKRTRYWRCSSTAYITTNRPSSCDQMIVACLLLLEKHMRNWKRYRMLWNATTRHVVLVILKGQHFLNLQSNASDMSNLNLSIVSWLPFYVVWTNKKVLSCREQYIVTVLLIVYKYAWNCKYCLKSLCMWSNNKVYDWCCKNRDTWSKWKLLCVPAK